MTSILIAIDRHLRSTGLPPTRFGRMVANDPRLVGDIRRGRAIGRRLRARIEAFIGGTGQ